MAERAGLPSKGRKPKLGSAKRKNEKIPSFGKILKSTGSFFSLPRESIPLFAEKFSIFYFLFSIFYLIGRPIFYLSLFILYSLFFILLFTGNFVLRLIKLICSFIKTTGQVLSRIKLPKIKMPRVKIALPKIATFSFFAFILLLAAFSFFYFSILKDLPSPNKLITRDQLISTKIYDRNGKLLYKIYRTQNRSLIKLKDIPLSLREATIAIEDGNFYYHSGFTIRGIVRAAFNNIFRGKLQGGSTITQQLIKSALLSPERTLTRKIKELILAIQVESRFSKDEILQMYFNEVGYGGAAYGAEEASQFYFGKSVRDLNWAESSLLAGLPASPTRYSPFGAHPELAKRRQAEVLRRMVEKRFLTKTQAEEIRRTPLVFAPQRIDIKAPHFVMYIKDLLVQKYGEKMVEEGGLEVTTSLDLNVQKMAEKVVRQELRKISRLKVKNAAALVTKPFSGEILAMVGSKDYFDLKNDGNVNVTIMPRQPGSAIKIINYAYALSHGYTPATILSDTPIRYKIPGQPPYSPKNYDHRFHGNVPLRTALASSYNVPAVKVLASYGVAQMIKEGQKMGITTWNDPSRYGLSLTLGAAEVKMTDLAVAYGVLANSGRKVNLTPILKVKNYKGKVLEDHSSGRQTAGSPVLDPRVAYILTSILSDNQARTPTFGSHSLLNIPKHTVAVKTGTSQNLRDNWCIGYTPDYLTSVWVGNNDDSPMSWIASGITGATPIWNKIMANLLKGKPDRPFPQPKGLQKVAICPINGLLPCEGCPAKVEYFLAGTEPKVHCLWEKEKQEKKEAPDQLLEGISTGH